jgi:hypothetical protein
MRTQAAQPLKRINVSIIIRGWPLNHSHFSLRSIASVGERKRTVIVGKLIL